MKLRPLTLLVCLAWSCSAQAAGSAAAEGARQFAQCVPCHRADGAGNPAVLAPPLAGLDAEYVGRQLRHFRDRLRGGDATTGPAATMRAVALTLRDDAQISSLAAYVAGLKAVRRPPASAPESTMGKGLYGVCVACHGGRGEGNRALQSPRLDQLPGWYIEAQLKAFRSGERGAAAQDVLGLQMRSVVLESLADDGAAKAVADYIGSLGGVKPARAEPR